MINFEAIEHEQVLDSAIPEAAGAVALESFANNPLSPRELELLGLASRGFSNIEIGEQALIDEETVKTHLRNGYSKIEAKNRPHAVNILIRERLIPVSANHKPVKLSPRMAEVLPLIAEGLTNKEIASHLGLGEETVKTHIRNALAVLGAGNRAHAVRRMYETGQWEVPEAS